MHSHITFAIMQKEGSIMKESVKKLEALMEIGGIKKDICFLVISGIALIISIFKLSCHYSVWYSHYHGSCHWSDHRI